MPFTPKVLGQNVPGSTLTTLYTVPAATSTQVMSIMVCNQTVLDQKFRISVAIAGAADAIAQYIYYDTTVPANDTVLCQIEGALAATDVIRDYASNANVSFTAFGVEVS